MLLMLLIGILSCEESLPGPATQPNEDAPFIGSWAIKSAKLDGIEQAEWEGKRLRFDQLKPDSGRYEFRESQYDSIWPQEGGWLLTDSKIFMRSDSAWFMFSIRSDRNFLDLVMEADWLVTFPTCEEEGEICLPANGGNWVFGLEAVE